MRPWQAEGAHISSARTVHGKIFRKGVLPVHNNQRGWENWSRSRSSSPSGRKLSSILTFLCLESQISAVDRERGALLMEKVQNIKRTLSEYRRILPANATIRVARFFGCVCYRNDKEAAQLMLPPNLLFLLSATNELFYGHHWHRFHRNLCLLFQSLEKQHALVLGPHDLLDSNRHLSL